MRTPVCLVPAGSAAPAPALTGLSNFPPAGLRALPGFPETSTSSLPLETDYALTVPAAPGEARGAFQVAAVLGVAMVGPTTCLAAADALHHPGFPPFFGRNRLIPRRARIDLVESAPAGATPDD